jgi:hypothetical protein
MITTSSTGTYRQSEIKISIGRVVGWKAKDAGYSGNVSKRYVASQKNIRFKTSVESSPAITYHSLPLFMRALYFVFLHRVARSQASTP